MAELQAIRPNQNSGYTYPSHTYPSYPPPQPQYSYAPPASSIAPPQHTYAPSVPTIPPTPPPQYSYNVPTPPDQASSGSKTLFNIIYAVLLVLAIIVGTIFILRSSLHNKSFVRFNVNSAQLNQFELSRVTYSYSGPFTYTDPLSYMLDYSLALSYTLRNSYKINVQYQLINVTAYYDPNDFQLLALNDSQLYPEFHADPKTDVRYNNVSFEGYGKYNILYGTDSYFNAAPRGGPFSFYVNMKVKVSYSSYFLSFFLKEFWNLWQCFEVPLSNSTYQSSYQDFQLTKCVNVKNFKG